ncbi:MAG: hypothetical protein OHK0036_20160 [Bacteroidia bacterium]
MKQIKNIKKYPWYSSYQFAGNKPIIAIDLDGKEDLWTNTTEFANGFKVTTTIFKGDDNYEMSRQAWAAQMGIDVSKLPQTGALSTYQKYDESGKVVSMMANYNPAVEVTASREWSSLANEMGHYLENSRLKEVNDAFIRRYYGDEGQERFLSDLEKGSTYVKVAGVGVGVVGAITLQPEIVAAGVSIYEYGSTFEVAKDVIETVKNIDKKNYEGIINRGIKFASDKAFDKAIDLQRSSEINKLMTKYVKDASLDKVFDNKNNENRNNIIK